MDKLHNDFINLIYSIVTKNKIDASNIDVNRVFELAKYHSLSYLIIKAFEFNNISYDDEIKKVKNQEYMKAVSQMAELDSIKEELNINHIKHLPLKGSIIRTYYLDPIMRSMADLDILVNKNEVKKTKKVLLSLGYEKFASNETAPHDSFIKKPFMEVEIHRKLVMDDAVTSDYLKNIWDKTERNENYTYYLNINDFYIYNIIHSVKHFSSGGTGVRILIDLYYLLNSDLKFDFDYIEKELKLFNYDKYESLLRTVSKKIFGLIEFTEDEELFLEYLITSGTYGTTYNAIVTGVKKLEDNNQKNSKFKYFMARLFPNYKTMVKRNPILKKLPFLLPFFWITRLIKGLIHHKERLGEVKQISNVDDKAMKKRERIEEITEIKDFYN